MADNKEPPPDINKKNISPGFVLDLEKYVQPDWWKYIFDSLYLKTDGDVVNDLDITKKEIDYFLSILNISKEQKILDLCCGHGRHSLELARRGFKNVEGLDKSRVLIQKAKKLMAEEGLSSLKFREGDARKTPYQNNEFDFVLILGNSFGYFEKKEEDLMVLKEAFRILKNNGKILLDVSNGSFLRENFEKRSWEWIGKNEFVVRERSLSSDNNRLISREIIININKGVIADRFYAERLYSTRELKSLLEEAGFSNFIVHGMLSPDSKRNQDLGMMKNRIIVTAESNKEEISKTYILNNSKEEIEPKIVAVILGDPKKWDYVKGNFDNDDLETIEKLKEALSNIQKEGYFFIYLNNHETLLEDLIRLKDKIKFVFNLCEEGLNNDATKELHIPTLLEWLNIPYTGASPQCLAHCYDKSLIRGLAKEMKIPVADAFIIKPSEVNIKIPIKKFPVIVKPNFGDSSFGITQKSVAHNHQQLLDAISEINNKYKYKKPIIVEEFLTGKDLTIGIIGNPPYNYEIVGITEDDYSELPPEFPKICGYEAKWEVNSPYFTKIKTIIADITKEQRNIIVNSSLILFERLGCRDYARFDWRLDKNGWPRFLEANPNPGWCWDGHLAKMCSLFGIDYKTMLLKIIKVAEKRLEEESKNTQEIINVQTGGTSLLEYKDN
ncbi:MAG: methyltransferase domain-containing protein [Candidatus Pacearchaeota archaeon]